jgi:hypothetical protein
MAFGTLFHFPQVFEKEIASINKRRAELKRDPVVLESEPPTAEGITPKRPAEDTPIVGLALSGGGARSAAFCLGALQALDAAKVLPKVDYLSTVSGGGYIGSSLTAGMTSNKGKFPFASNLREDEPPALQHVRNYSNYLFPQGAWDLLYNLAIYLRGLAANIVLVLPFLLIGAAITIALHPKPKSPLTIPGTDLELLTFLMLVAAGVLVFLILWGWIRSLPALVGRLDYPNQLTRAAGGFIISLALVGFLVVQPFLLDVVINQGGTGFFDSFNAWVKVIIAVLAPIAGVISFTASKLGEVAKKALESEDKGGKIAGYAAQVAIYIAALVMPALIWLCYLLLSYWGMCSGTCERPLAPGWLITAAHWVPFGSTWPLLVPLYLLVAVVGLIIGYCLTPNANSLHPLYRDRLSKAFLFRPVDTLPVPSDPRAAQPELEQARPKLSDLSEVTAPYHLINTALNLQNSEIANKRGRNGDFFVFSRNFIGSKTTRYVATADVEQVVGDLDLAAAMSASGAAAASNMGAATIKPLTPTLALLNIRLGFWMRNPIRLTERFSWNPFADLYFLYELVGGLNESRRQIYLTDGGHIENLGIYELLRRRCKVIIAVDAECDPNMTFASFNKLERHALIDLGVRIDLPWADIGTASKETGKAIDKKGDAPKKSGPHVAVGEILYPDKRRGVLVYIKSSLTGDENDYVFDYKRRYSAFPHETTVDQLFSEEQFEAYRALGFHCAHGFFNRRDKFAHRDLNSFPSVRWELGLLDKIFPIAEGKDLSWPRKSNTFLSHLPARSRRVKPKA